MILGVQIRAPARLATAPDDDLSELLLGHWLARASTGPQYVADDALICVLGMCAEWLAAIQSERWPPPWI
jgi:hypothetical protein